MGKVKLIISMDWEGCDLLERNLNAIKNFKKKYNCPLAHYLNAGYYTNPKTKGGRVTSAIKGALGSDDEQAMHLHAPRHFVQAAGVGVRAAPTFSKLGDYNSGHEFGQEVMLHGYDKAELDRLISYSKSVLEERGFSRIKAFRAGGWMCDEKMFDSLSENDFEVESSATVAGFLEGSSWENDNLQRYISLIWEGITPESSPYMVKGSKKDLLEIPNNLGAIDYWQPSWMAGLSERCLANSEQSDYLAVVNSHQETFADHAAKLENLIDDLIRKGANLEFITNREVLNSWKSA